MSETSIEKRRNTFRRKLEPRLILLSVIISIVGLSMSALSIASIIPFNYFVGLAVFCAGAVVTLSIRNYYFAQQSTYEEIRSTLPYISLRKWLSLILALYGLFVLFFPRVWINQLQVGSPSLWAVLFFTIIGILITVLNNNFPWWVRQRQLREHEIDKMKLMYSKLDNWFEQLELLKEQESTSADDFVPESYRYREHIALLRKDMFQIKDVVRFIGLGLYMVVTREENLPGDRIKVSLVLLGALLSFSLSVVKITIFSFAP